MVDLDLIRLQGRVAGSTGKKADACPYRGSSLHRERNAWIAGFNEGKAERKARATR